MEPLQMTEQLLAFQRKSFDAWCNLMGVMDEQSDSALQLFSKDLGLLPEQGCQAMRRWLSACQKERNRFQEFVHNGFDVAAGLVTKPQSQPQTA